MDQLEKYLPKWDFAKKNKLKLNSKSHPPISCIYHVNFGDSLIIKTLFFLRGMPTKNLYFQNFVEGGFILLEETEQEIILGLVAQPWKIKGQIQKISREDFLKFEHPKYVKIVWNFTVDDSLKDEAIITTETRIHCTSQKAKKKFTPYWIVIRFFSGVVRQEMLKLIRKEMQINKG